MCCGQKANKTPNYIIWGDPVTQVSRHQNMHMKFMI